MSGDGIPGHEFLASTRLVVDSRQYQPHLDTFSYHPPTTDDLYTDNLNHAFIQLTFVVDMVDLQAVTAFNELVPLRLSTLFGRC
jgi:hypothetical protein